MTKINLSIQEEFWLSATLADKCPYCGKEVSFTPKDMYFRLGSHGTHNGVPFKEAAGFCHDCEHCGNKIMIDVVFQTSEEFNKSHA